MKNLATVACLLSLIACTPEISHREKPPIRIETFQVNSAENALARQVPGLVVGADQTLLSFRIEGRIEAMFVEEGAQIKAGEVLARLDDTKKVHQLNEVKANLRLAQSQLIRIQELYKKAMVSDAELDHAKANFALRKTSQQLAQRQLSYTYLYAPVNGVIAKAHVEDREFVSPGEPVLTIYRDDRLDVELTVSDSLLTQIGEDFKHKEYQVVLDQGKSEQKITMRYLQHTYQPDPQSQNYKLWLTADAPESPVPPGTKAYVTLVENSMSTNTFLVPATALDVRSGAYHVWQVNQQATYSVPVELVAIRASGILIKAPIEQGALLANSNLRKLSEGQSVVGDFQ